MWPVLSFSLAVLIHWSGQSYCEATNATTTTMLRLLLLYQFWLVEICICNKPIPPEMRPMTYKLHSPRKLIVPFFSILPALHMQDRFTLVTSWFFLSSFFPFGVAMKRIQFTQLHCHISFLSSGSPPIFYPAGNGCWIHVNISCSACIYTACHLSLWTMKAAVCRFCLSILLHHHIFVTSL